MVKTIEQDNKSLRSKWRLWVGVLLPPTAWSAALEAVYLTNVYTCAGSAVRWSHISSAIGLIFCVLGGFIAWQSMPPKAANDAKTVPISRSIFMAWLGVALAFLFGLLIIAQWLPILYGVPCSK